MDVVPEKALTVVIVDAPSTFADRLKEALPEGQFVSLESAAVSRSSDALAVIYCLGALDRRVLTRVAARARRIVVVSESMEGDSVLRALDAGVEGFLDASISSRALRSALIGVTRGEIAYPRRVFGDWLRMSRTTSAVADLTPRQRQILDLIAAGASDKEIAATLGIQGATAQKHVARLLRRLGARNRAAAVAMRPRRLAG